MTAPWLCTDCGKYRLGLPTEPCPICKCASEGHEPTQHRDHMGERTGHCRCWLYREHVAESWPEYDYHEAADIIAERSYEECMMCGRLQPVPCPCERADREAEQDEFESKTQL